MEFVLASVHGAVTSNLLNEISISESLTIFLVVSFVTLKMTIGMGKIV